MPVVYQIMVVTENQNWYMQLAILQTVHGKLDVVVIEAMSATFNLPKSKFESFRTLPLSFMNHTVKETSTSSTVIVSFDSYYEN